jgi:hypothetical protein
VFSAIYKPSKVAILVLIIQLIESCLLKTFNTKKLAIIMIKYKDIMAVMNKHTKALLKVLIAFKIKAAVDYQSLLSILRSLQRPGDNLEDYS